MTTAERGIFRYEQHDRRKVFHASPAGVPPQLSTLVHRSIEESEAGRGGLEFAEGEGERYRIYRSLHT
jgi:hypothetical protein